MSTKLLDKKDRNDHKGDVTNHDLMGEIKSWQTKDERKRHSHREEDNFWSK